MIVPRIGRPFDTLANEGFTSETIESNSCGTSYSPQGRSLPMDPSWIAQEGNQVGNGNGNYFGLEKDYLRETLWREEHQSKQLQEQLRRHRDKVLKTDIEVDTRKELRKKINSLNRRLKRSQKTIKAINENMTSLTAQENVLRAQNYAAETEYAKRLQQIQHQTILDLQNQVQQLSLAAAAATTAQQNPFSLNYSMASPEMPPSHQTANYAWTPGLSPVFSDGCSPLYSPFYSSQFRPFNYISGQLLAPSPLKRHSVAVSPTDIVNNSRMSSDSTLASVPGVLYPRNSIWSTTDPFGFDAKQRAMSLPTANHPPRRRSSAVRIIDPKDTSESGGSGTSSLRNSR